jgi:hypothetical protein
MHDGMLLYADKKKSLSWLRTVGLQLPKVGGRTDSAHTILERADLFKPAPEVRMDAASTIESSTSSAAVTASRNASEENQPTASTTTPKPPSALAIQSTKDWAEARARKTFLNSVLSGISRNLKWGEAVGGRTKRLNEIIRERNAKIGAAKLSADFIAKRLASAMNAGRHWYTIANRAILVGKPLTQQQKDALMAYAKGEITADAIPGHATSARVQAARKIADEMRTQQDRISNELIATGLLTDDMAITLERNKGKYILRAYAKYLNTNYTPTMDHRTAAADLIQEQLHANLDDWAAYMTNKVAEYATPEKRQELADYVATGNETILTDKSAAFLDKARILRANVQTMEKQFGTTVNIERAQRDFTADIATLNAELAQIEELLAKPGNKAEDVRNERYHRKSILAKLEELRNSTEQSAFKLTIPEADLRAIIDGTLQHILESGTKNDPSAATPGATNASAKWKAVTHSLTRRGEIPETIRKYMGEINDLAVAGQIMLGRGNQMLIQYKYNQILLDEFGPGTAKPLFTSGTPKGDMIVQLPDSVAYGPLRNLYTTKEMYEDLMVNDNKEIQNNFGRYLMGICSVLRVSKTVGNPSTHLRQFIGNPYFTMGSGEALYAHYPKAWAQAANLYCRAIIIKDPAAMSEFVELNKIGLLGTTVETGEIRDMLKQIGDTSRIDTPEKFNEWLAEKYKRGLGKAAAIYTISDNVTKMAAYNSKIRRLTMDAGMNLADAKTEALRQVRREYPFHDMIPEGIRKFGKYNILIGDFVGFFSEALRNTVNNIADIPITIKAAAAAHKDGNAKLARHLTRNAINRITGAALAHGTALAGTNVLAHLLGALGGGEPPDDKKERAKRALQPAYARYAAQIFLNYKDGTSTVMNWEYINPFNLDNKMWMATRAMAGHGVPGETRMDATKALFGQFFGTPMGYQFAADLLSGTNNRTGQPITENTNDLTEKLMDYALFIAKQVGPQAIGNVIRTVELANADQPLATYDGSVDTIGNQALGIVAPTRIREWNTSQAAVSRFRELAHDIATIKGKANSAIRLATPDADLGTAKTSTYTAENEAAKAEHKLATHVSIRAYDLVTSLDTLGIDTTSTNEKPGTLSAILKDAGWSKADADSLIRTGEIHYTPPKNELNIQPEEE